MFEPWQIVRFFYLWKRQGSAILDAFNLCAR
jgi:hypothetical protein